MRTSPIVIHCDLSLLPLM